MTRAVRASGPQVMGNAFQMQLGLLGQVPKPCFQTTQASSILMQCGTPAVGIPLPLDSTSIPGPGLRGFWSPRWGMEQLLLGQQKVGLGLGSPKLLMTHPVCRGSLSPLLPASQGSPPATPNLASRPICQGYPASG